MPTPRKLGYRAPAEWEPHAATWVSWPHKEESWPGRFDAIPAVFSRIVARLSRAEAVNINVNDAEMERQARDCLQAAEAALERVRTWIIPTNDAWCRDHGPTFLVRDSLEGRDLATVDWRFNAWGEKYPPYDLDDRVPSRIAEALGIPGFRPEIVMEGGSFDVNGAGSVLTTESCLLNPNRNPHLTRRQIEDYLREYLAVDQFLWLGDGIAGDDTDGHVDDLARFVDPRTIVTAVEDDAADDNYRALRDNLRRLEAMRDLDGNPYRIVTLPMPPALYYEGQRVPCSYANFYIANGTVLVPIFECAADAEALATLRGLFPDRSVVGIDCRDLVWGLGALHCVTQQQPASDGPRPGVP
ncbi:MAG: agmatine deiminase family protein [Acidobacteria bacterium]|nr:agmatine deiminase family protein [Acidobacteriota bacterium]